MSRATTIRPSERFLGARAQPGVVARPRPYRPSSRVVRTPAPPALPARTESFATPTWGSKTASIAEELKGVAIAKPQKEVSTLVEEDLDPAKFAETKFAGVVGMLPTVMPLNPTTHLSSVEDVANVARFEKYIIGAIADLASRRPPSEELVEEINLICGHQ